MAACRNRGPACTGASSSPLRLRLAKDAVRNPQVHHSIGNNGRIDLEPIIVVVSDILIGFAVPRNKDGIGVGLLMYRLMDRGAVHSQLCLARLAFRPTTLLCRLLYSRQLAGIAHINAPYNGLPSSSAEGEGGSWHRLLHPPRHP